MPHDQQKTVLHALLAHDCSPGDLEPLGAVLRFRTQPCLRFQQASRESRCEIFHYTRYLKDQNVFNGASFVHQELHDVDKKST